MSTVSSPVRPTPQFSSNQVPSHSLLEYLWSELRSRRTDREQLALKKEAYENEATVYADVIKREEPVLVSAQKAVEYHSATIDYLRSCPTAPVLDTDDKPTDRNTSPKINSSLSSQVSQSSREIETLVESEQRRLVRAKEVLQEISTRLEEPKVHLMVREKKAKHFEQLIDTLDAEIHELALLMRPQLRLPDEVWLLVFSVLLEEDNRLYRTKDQRWLFVPPTFIASQVCRHWRRITYSHSSLWTKLGFHFDRYWEPRQLGLFRFLLERAGDQKVFLMVDMSSPRSKATEETEYIDIQSIGDLQNREFILGIENPPRTLKLQELCDQTGITSFAAIVINGSNLRLNIGELEQLPETRTASFFDFFPSSSAAVLGDLHALHLYAESCHRTIDATPFLLNNLRELTLRGDCIDLPSDSEDKFVLPELTSLRISPLQQGFLRRLIAPCLTTLTLDPPDGPDEKIGNDWSFPLLRVSSSCSLVKFDMWERLSIETSAPPYCLASAVCSEIARSTQKLVTVQFIDTYIDGEQLVDGFRGLIASTLGRKVVEEIMIDRCTGITRIDCNALMEMVGCLKVYV